MAKARTLVGLDVHASKIVAAVLDAETGELQFFSMTADIGSGRPRAHRVRVGDHPDRVTTTRTRPHPVGWVGGGPARAGNPRLIYEQSAPGLATLDSRQRLPTTNHGPAVANPRISV